MGHRTIHNDERTHVSRLEEMSGRDERVLRISKHWDEVAMCSSSEILVDILGVCFYIYPKHVDRFKGGFVMDGSEVGSIKEGVLVIYIDRHVG